MHDAVKRHAQKFCIFFSCTLVRRTATQCAVCSLSAFSAWHGRKARSLTEGIKEICLDGAGEAKEYDEYGMLDCIVQVPTSCNLLLLGLIISVAELATRSANRVVVSFLMTSR